MNYQELAAKAPQLEGHRLLDENEPAQVGDGFLYMTIYDFMPASWRAGFKAEHLADVDASGTIQVGRSWAEAKKVFESDAEGLTFDGAIYRPIKK